MPGEQFPMSTEEKVESIEIAADYLQVSLDDRLGMSQCQRCKELTRSAVADGRVVLERCKFPE